MRLTDPNQLRHISSLKDKDVEEIAKRYPCTGHYKRKLHTKAGEVTQRAQITDFRSPFFKFITSFLDTVVDAVRVLSRS